MIYGVKAGLRGGRGHSNKKKGGVFVENFEIDP